MEQESSNFIINEIQKCELKKYMSFLKGDTIMSMSGNEGIIGLLIEGTASILSIDENGHETIYDFLTTGNSFGDYLVMLPEKKEYIVTAESDCTVLFINYENIINNCYKNCENHSELIKKTLLFTVQRAQSMSLHINILSQKSIRNKLLTYFDYLDSHSDNSGQITVPVTFERLASYLGTDRSALMREIRRMNNDGIISSKGRKIQLYKKH